MFKRFLIIFVISICFTEEFSEGPFGTEYFDIAGPFSLVDLNLELGDVNSDNIVNILDIITLVNCILSNNCDICFDVDDNQDLAENWLDEIGVHNDNTFRVVYVGNLI